jgi:chromosome segregation ATPase
LREIEAEILSLRRRIEKEDRKEGVMTGRETEIENKLKKIREEEMKALRELGRLEGVIAFEEKAAKETGREVISKKEAETILKSIVEAIDKVATLEMLPDLKKKVLDFMHNLSPARREEVNIDEKRKELASLRAGIEKLGAEAKELSKKYEAEIHSARREAEETRKDEKKVYQLELEAGRLKDSLRSVEFEEEKIKLLREEYKREVEEANLHIDGHIPSSNRKYNSTEDMNSARKNIERGSSRKLWMTWMPVLNPTLERGYQG